MSAPPDRPPTRSRRALSLIPLLLLAGYGVWSFWQITETGMGLSPDSTRDLAAARNFSEGRGFVETNWSTGEETVPLTHYPPWLSFSLGVGSLLSTPGHAARVLHAALYGLNLLLIGLSVWLFARRALLPAVLGMLLFLVSVEFQKCHVFIWSEPWMLFLSLSGILLLSAYCESRRTRYLVFAGIAVALAILDRYVAIVLIPTGGVGILLFLNRPLWQRIRNAVLFGLFSFLPTALWLLRNKRVADNLTNRPLGFKAISDRHFQMAGETIVGWFRAGEPAAQAVPAVLWGIAAITAALIVGLAWRTATPERRKKTGIRLHALPWFLLLFGTFYFGFLLFSISWIDHRTRFGYRILLPLQAVFPVFVLCSGYALLASRRWSAGVGLALLVAGGVLAWQLHGESARTAVEWEKRTKTAPNWNARPWLASPVVEGMKELPADRLIYCNTLLGPYYVTGRKIRVVPRRGKGDVKEQVDRLCTELREKRAFLVDVKRISWARAVAGRGAVIKACGLEPVERFTDGVIYVRPDVRKKQ